VRRPPAPAGGGSPVFFHKPADGVINKAKEWFGEENVVNIA
jgi:hypothetical protein